MILLRGFDGGEGGEDSEDSEVVGARVVVGRLWEIDTIESCRVRRMM